MLVIQTAQAYGFFYSYTQEPYDDLSNEPSEPHNVPFEALDDMPFQQEFFQSKVKLLARLFVAQAIYVQVFSRVNHAQGSRSFYIGSRDTLRSRHISTTRMLGAQAFPPVLAFPIVSAGPMPTPSP